MPYPTGFQINGSDFNDVYVRAELFTEGGLWLWGHNGFSNLGTNDRVHRSSPVQTVSGGTNWKQLSSGSHHVSVIKTDGSLWTWGYNTFGQLGDASQTSRSSPVQTVSTGTNWKQVSSGFTYTAAIKTDGTLWTWGRNLWGNLGNNDGSQATQSSPVQTVAQGTNWKLVACGGYQTAAIKTDGTLWMWGSNNFGELGNNSGVAHRSSPIQTISGGTNWKFVACGNYTTSAIKTDGTLWTWGWNQFGQLGDNTTTNRSSPVQTISQGTNWKSLGASYVYVSAIKTDGRLWLWGNNEQGFLGDNSTTHRSSPVQTVSTGTNWKQLAGFGRVIAAIKTDGTLWGWGHNTQGSLGDNTTTHRSSPVQTVTQGTNWKQVSAGLIHVAAIRDQW